MTYREIIKIIQENQCECEEGEALDYSDSPEKDIFDIIQNHSQRDLDNWREIFGVEVYLYFTNRTTINAFVNRKEGCATIAMTQGLITGMGWYTEKILNLPQFAESEHLVQFIRTLIPLHFYCHEKAHHLQMVESKSYFLDESTEGDLELTIDDQLTEYDADIYATFIVYNAIIDDAKESEEIDDVIIEKLGIYCASIYWVFYRMTIEKDGLFSDLYYCGYKHPHPLLRVLYIIDRIVIWNRIRIVDKDIVLRKFLTYVREVICQIDEDIKSEELISIIRDNESEILSYINKLEALQENMSNSALRIDPNIVLS